MALKGFSFLQIIHNKILEGYMQACHLEMPLIRAVGAKTHLRPTCQQI